MLHHGPLRWGDWTSPGAGGGLGWHSVVHEPGLDGMAVGQGRGHNHAGAFAERLGQRADELVGLGRLKRNSGRLAPVLNDGAGVLRAARRERLVGLLGQVEDEVLALCDHLDVVAARQRASRSTGDRVFWAVRSLRSVVERVVERSMRARPRSAMLPSMSWKKLVLIDLSP